MNAKLAAVAKGVVAAIVLSVMAGSAAAKEGSVELYTNVYVVPPTFLSTGGGDAHDAHDPFTPATDDQPLEPKTTATDVLRGVGIVFPEGSSAIYNPSTSQLIVRNTIDQMELVEAYIESIQIQVEMQVYLVARFVEMDEPFFPDSSAAEADPASYPSYVRAFESKDALVDILASGEFDQLEKGRIDIGPGDICGVLTEPQMDVLLSTVAKRTGGKGTVSKASAMLRSGQGSLLLATRDRGIGVESVVIGADGFSLDLSLLSPGPPVKGRDSRAVRSTSITIWDGQVVMLERKMPDGAYQYELLSARIVDPAGMRVNESGTPPVPPAEKSIDELLEEAAGSAEVDDLSPQQIKSVKESDKAALLGSQKLAQGDAGAAAEHFRKALQILPPHSMTKEREQAYVQQYLTAIRKIPRSGGH